jgi:hypothetical protein
MPLWYWQDIAEYKIDVDAIETYIKLLRAEQDVQKMQGLKERGIQRMNGMMGLAIETRIKVDEKIQSMNGMTGLAIKTRIKVDEKIQTLTILPGLMKK